MLKISKSIEYSILALKYISEHSDEESVNAKKISSEANIPFELLAKLLQKMAREGIISSIQGTRGGYHLSVNPSELNLLSVMNAVEQNVQLTDCSFEGATADDCPRMENCCLRNPLTNIQNKILDLFNKVTLAEII
jgi:Rrf2 family protein